jgi:hypothetical protein
LPPADQASAKFDKRQIYPSLAMTSANSSRIEDNRISCLLNWILNEISLAISQQSPANSSKEKHEPDLIHRLDYLLWKICKQDRTTPELRENLTG